MDHNFISLFQEDPNTHTTPQNHSLSLSLSNPLTGGNLQPVIPESRTRRRSERRSRRERERERRRRVSAPPRRQLWRWIFTKAVVAAIVVVQYIQIKIWCWFI
ncbi:hypothetical protein Hanom_Chr06g00563591 [Helianthus anomalus]